MVTELKKRRLYGCCSNSKRGTIGCSTCCQHFKRIAGRATGIITRSQGGRPGADNQTIFIRGQATTGNATPLIVVDGIPRNNINEIDPNNIETVTILKDAAAVAPFGLGWCKRCNSYYNQKRNEWRTQHNFQWLLW